MGSLNNTYATRDTAGRKINDPYPTAFTQSGFDLDAVGVVHIKSVGLAEKENVKKLSIYPNPVRKHLFFNEQLIGAEWEILNLSGRLVKNGRLAKNQMNCSELKSGVYLLKLIHQNELYQAKLIVE